MKWWFKAKDGGPESTVWGYWLIEWKRFFSVVLLNFRGKSREAYHSHAFGALSWVLKGELREIVPEEGAPLPDENAWPVTAVYRPSLRPVWTPRERFHKVDAAPNTWVLSFRGPWVQDWFEFIPDGAAGQVIHLGQGRVRIA